MIVYIDINEEQRVRGWGSSPISKTCVEFDLPECHRFFINPYSYRLIEDNLIKDRDYRLSLVKKEKFDELKTVCEKEILGYFTALVDSVEYKFSYDEKAQSNLNSTMVLFNEGLITEVEWTAHREGSAVRILLNREQFSNVFFASHQHRDSRVTKLRSFLLPLIESCQSIKEVKSIKW